MKYFLFLNFAFLFISLFNQIQSQAEADLVTSIPDCEYIGTLYSGFLQVSEVKKFHYMLNYAQENPDNKPLVLWFNGGPGCSSLANWAEDHGPSKFSKDDKKLHKNEYSWIKEANMLYIESPGNVGFSKIDSTSADDLKINDEITAKENLQALLKFYEKFPGMKTHSLYISGVSYAGIYVPTLASEVIDYNKDKDDSVKIKLKGIFVGNGLTDPPNDDSATYDFIFTHYLSSYEDRLEYIKYCKNEYNEEKCNKLLESILKELEEVNMYDYLRQCDTAPKSYSFSSSNSNSYYYGNARWFFDKIKYSKNSSKLMLSIPCIDSTELIKYFNRKDVQEALHVSGNWDMCSDSVYNAYVQNRNGSYGVYPKLLEEKIRILIYNGDTDLVVPYNANQMWIKKLQLAIQQPWRQWKVDGNIAGYVTKYEGLTFCTIKGTGHMATQWKPKETYYMFSRWINEQDL